MTINMAAAGVCGWCAGMLVVDWCDKNGAEPFSRVSQFVLVANAVAMLAVAVMARG